ncbi:MAG: hypothetical protein ACHQF4_07775 [Sphingobacteriales bacterium]
MKKCLLLALILITSIYCYGQSSLKTATEALTAQNDSVKSIAASPVKSALSEKTLTQFIQSTVTTGKGSGYNFSSSFFAIGYLFSRHKDSLSNYYLHDTKGRNTQLSIGANKANSDRISLITLGLTYAPINHRDKSLVNFSAQDNLLEDIQSVDHALVYTRIIYTTRFIINKALSDNIKSSDQLKTALGAAQKLNDQKIKKAGTNNWTDNDIESILVPIPIDAPTIKKIEQEFAGLYGSIKTNSMAYRDTSQKLKPDSNFKAIGDSVFKALFKLPYDLKFKDLQKKFDNISKKIDMGSLLTVSLTPGYNIQFAHWDTTSVTIRYLYGFGKNVDKPWNIDAQASFVSLQDSSAQHKEFNHNTLKLILGLDKVFARNGQDDPLFEIEFQGQYNNVFSGKYVHEEQQSLTANLVTTIHLTKEFNLPVTLKYDPKTTHLFGILSLQWNLQDSGKK